MKETASVPSPPVSKMSKGLLMVPKNAAAIMQHRRAGSTGTTGDESYTTDEEDNVEIDEPDLHVPAKLFNHDSSDFGSFSDIATITDKVVMHRNSSDSSVYSDLGLEKLEKEEDQGDWARQVVGAKEQTFNRLQDELRDAHQELKLKDEEVARLSRIRQDVEAELEDLTASLFQVNFVIEL